MARVWGPFLYIALLAGSGARAEGEAAAEWLELSRRLETGLAGEAEIARFLGRWCAWVAEAPAGGDRWLPELEVALDALRVRATGPTRGLEPDALADRIRELPRGGTSAWDEVVRALLLAAVDVDGSGAIDQDAELEGVPCEAWLAIDGGVREGWAAGLYVTYGFAADLLWIGDALGVSAVLRGTAAERLRACALPGTEPVDAAGVDPVRMVEALSRLPEVGEPAWTAVVRSMVVGLYDADGSGDLDSASEARAVDCAVWSGLDAALRGATGEGLVATHRLDEVGGYGATRLGFEATMGALALDAVSACGLGASGPRLGPAGAPLAPWDLDGSGSVDRGIEVRAVPCEVWTSLDAASRDDLGLGATEAWGLGRGWQWGGGVVGLDVSVRGAVRRALGACGHGG